MRKTILFALVFGAGLALLLWLSRTGPAPTVHTQRPTQPLEPAVPNAEQDPKGYIELPLGEGGEGLDEGAIQIGIEGAFAATVVADEPSIDAATGAEVRRRLYRIDARDSTTLTDGTVEMTGIEVEFFDPESGELFARADADRARARPRQVDDGLVFEEGLTLFDVELELLRGVPVVPLKVRVPQLVCTPDDGRFKSSDQVQVEAQGVDARGTGLVVDTAGQSLQLVRDGRIELLLERGGSVLLETTGPGPLDFVGTGRGDATEIEIRASDGARFKLSGDAELEASGERIAIRAQGSEREGQDRAFRARSAVVQGDALVSGEFGSFRSREAQLSFDEQGRPAMVQLIGQPRGSVKVASFLDPTRPELYASVVELEGEGPLSVGFGERTEIDLVGPGVLRIPERAFELRAQERVRGRVGDASGELEARGAVRIDYAGRTLETDAIEATYTIRSPEAAQVDVATEGPTRVRGRDPQGREVSFDADRGGTFSARDGRVLVPVARGVRFEMGGPEPLSASADEVRDLDWTAGTFEALGNVVCERPDERASAARVVAHGPQELELFGAEGVPAVFQLWATADGAPAGTPRAERGRLEAQRILLVPGRADADGGVRCVMSVETDVYELTSQEAHLVYEEPRDDRRAFELTASEDVRVALVSARGDASLSARELVLVGSVGLRGADGQRAPSRSLVTARGDVVIDYRGRGGLRGEGDLFVIDERGAGRLSAEPGRRVHAIGRLPRGKLPYEMTALEVRFDADHVEAIDPDVGVAEDETRIDVEDASASTQAVAQPSAGEPAAAPQEQGPTVLGFDGQRFWADRTTILLEGDARVHGRLEDGDVWSVAAQAIEIRGRWDELEDETLRLEQVESLEARNGFEARLGERMRASGRRLIATPERFRMEGALARFELLTVVWESDWIEFDPVNFLVGTGTGEVRSKDPELSWTLSYESMQPFDDVDATMLVLRNPVLREFSGDDRREVRAAWALFWIDRKQWLAGGSRMLSNPFGRTELRSEELPPEAPPATGGEETRYEEMASFLREIYIEGNIEFLENERRLGRASALYLDRLGGLGWIQNANVLVDVDVRDRTETVRVKAGWMRIMADMQTPGLLPSERLSRVDADEAVITTCGFEQPHYVIETGELRLRRNPKSGLGYDFSARKNKARFSNGLIVPLPPINYGTNEEGNPVIGGFEVGDSARFGSVIRATTNLPLPRWTRKAIAGSFGRSWEDVRGGTRVSLGYLSSRGFLLGLGQQVRIADRMWMDTFFDIVPDSGEDRGMVRYKTDGDSWRTWFHGRGRLQLEPDEWIDLAFTSQSDQGFQSEFFEREFLRYEEQDNYVHWRKARNQHYFDASLAYRLEDFRTSVNEIPKLGAYRGSSPIGDILGQPVLYSADAQTGYLQRRFGREPFSPFVPVFVDADLDGDGVPDDFEVLRFDTEHRLEAPFDLGLAGLQATPFVSGRFTAWDQGAEEEEAPSRFAGFAGLELGTTLWRRFGDEFLHQLAPTVTVKSDVVSESNGDTPVQIDQVDLPIEGDVVELGLRSLLWRPNVTEPLKQTFVDIEARVGYVDGTDDDGILPIAFIGQALSYLDEMPIGMTHDGRYDTDEDQNIYSRTFLGIEPHHRLGVELGYSSGRDLGLETLYRAASFGMRYRATPKWELEADYTLSLLDDENLDSTFLVRRLGHDFVTELEISDRAGEGVSFGITLEPLVAWRRTRLGLLDNWLGTYR